ncbi:MAG: nucleoside triphosphate pyrophosphohydrolase [Bacteroidota bacterium]
METSPNAINATDPRLIAFQRLLDVMDNLREKCPWDRKQTLDSLRHLTIEETYELADAIISNDLDGLKGELGDLFLHLVFYSKIASEQGAFDVTDVLNAICEKLIYRHPHIYGDVVAESEDEVKSNWEKLKLKEGKTSVLQGVPVSLPALVKAIRIQDKVKGVGFDWEDIADVKAKVTEELSELDEAVASKDQNAIEDEFGDVMFSLVNYARFLQVNPEDALERTNRKFRERFMLMETFIIEAGKDISGMQLDEMDVYWEQAKKVLRKES